jgi:hypothetical protein
MSILTEVDPEWCVVDRVPPPPWVFNSRNPGYWDKKTNLMERPRLQVILERYLRGNEAQN